MEYSPTLEGIASEVIRDFEGEQPSDVSNYEIDPPFVDSLLPSIAEIGGYGFFARFVEENVTSDSLLGELLRNKGFLPYSSTLEMLPDADMIKAFYEELTTAYMRNNDLK